MILLGLPSFAVRALEFTPTDFEWVTWPPYCQARYTQSAAGRNSKFAHRVSPSKVEEWAQKLDGVFGPMHHYCAGVVIFERAQQMTDESAKRFHLDRVTRECSWTLARAEQTHPMYSKILTLRARAAFELGDRGQAIQELNRAIALHPEMPDAYAAAGVLLRRLGKREEARSILAQGVEAIDDNAELHYLLGFILFELAEYESAREHAELAYRFGYPLPGLKRKLQAAGHW